MPTPGLHPRSAPRPTGSQAERRVYEALRLGIPAGWYAWHSLRLRTRGAFLGEGDFVIAHPARGLVVLEVKGGSITQDDGHWYQNGARMDAPPLDQAHRFKRLLLERVHDGNCEPPAHGVAVAFPDVADVTGPTQDDIAAVTLDGDRLRWLDRTFPALVEAALPLPRRQRGNWIDRLHQLWGETWRPRLTLALRVRQGADDRVQLDEQQSTLLAALEQNTRVLVEGSAGSGKTLLARELAHRSATSGERVLILTFTEALSRWLAQGTPGVDVAPIRRFAVDLLGQVGLVLTLPPDAEEWEEISFRAAAEALPVAGSPYGLVVIDEAQDLTEQDWTLVEELARDRKLWAFHDPSQRFWSERTVPERLFTTRFRLPGSYRCHPAILALASSYDGALSQEGTIREAIHDGTIGIASCASAVDVANRIGLEIDRLCAGGLAPGDIAVISLRGRGADSAVLGQPRLGSHAIVSADHDDVASHVVVDTFLRFKGLERPAVIVTDIGGVATNRRDLRMHIALTRALDLARIVGEDAAIREDRVLASLLEW